MKFDNETLDQLEERRLKLTRPKWDGPDEFTGGITQSFIDRWLECPFRAYIYWILGLDENRKTNDNLIWGDTLHKGLELYIPAGGTIANATAEMQKYLADTYPGSNPTFKHTTAEMLKLYDKSYVIMNGLEDSLVTEHKFVEDYAYKYVEGSAQYVVIRGKSDVYSKPLRFGGEHKCKGRAEFASARRESPVDKQVLIYSKFLNIRHWIYDIICIPEAKYMIPQRRPAEMTEAYARRLFYGDTGKDLPISRNKHAWMHQFSFDVSKQLIDEFTDYTFNPMIKRIVAWWNHVTDDSFSLVNPNCYNEHFYVTPIRHFDPSNTEYYKCRYWDLLAGEQQVEDLIEVESFYSELEEV